MRAYYNEIEPYAAQWLWNLVAAGHLPPGDVDDRDIRDVQPGDLAGYGQCHFFAGIGGWALACRLAGWPDERPIWTGSCPCQPFSKAGRGAGTADERHLWPAWFRLIVAARPRFVVGEQVAAAVGHGWLDGVFADLEGVGYACGAVVVPACAVDAPHRRDRLWFTARAVEYARAGRHGAAGEAVSAGRAGAVHDGGGCALADATGARRLRSEDAGTGGCGASEGSPEAGRWGAGLLEPERGGPGDALAHPGAAGLPLSEQPGESSVAQRRLNSRPAAAERGGAWSDAVWLHGRDGKARRAEPGLRLLAHGVPGRVGQLRAFGNAIVPQLGAGIIGALMDEIGQPRVSDAAPSEDQRRGAPT